MRRTRRWGLALVLVIMVGGGQVRPPSAQPPAVPPPANAVAGAITPAPSPPPASEPLPAPPTNWAAAPGAIAVWLNAAPGHPPRIAELVAAWDAVLRGQLSPYYRARSGPPVTIRELLRVADLDGDGMHHGTISMRQGAGFCTASCQHPAFLCSSITYH